MGQVDNQLQHTAAAVKVSGNSLLGVAALGFAEEIIAQRVELRRQKQEEFIKDIRDAASFYGLTPSELQAACYGCAPSFTSPTIGNISYIAEEIKNREKKKS
jgi:hypothetical protein